MNTKLGESAEIVEGVIIPMKREIEINKKINRMRNDTLFSECIHKDEHCEEISDAHSIQNNGILNKLARNGMVMAVDFSKINLGKGKFKLREIGRKKASTFTGFCNHHDSKIFNPIEQFNYEPMNIKHNFLFAYRAFALGYYERFSSYQLIEARLNDDPSKFQTRLGERYNLYNNHLKYIDKLKTMMNTNLDNERFDRITTDLISWPEEYGIASTSMFFISKDNEGNTVNQLDYRLSPFFFTVFPQAGSTFVLMSYLTKDKLMYRFIKDQVLSLSVDQQKIAVSNIIAMYIENVFISPDFWDNLPNDTKEKYYEIANKIMGSSKPNKLIAFKDFNLFLG
ncbi:hypothetical protein [Paenibacillus sp. FSL R5-0928]